jgi:hypothetical protein
MPLHPYDESNRAIPRRSAAARLAQPGRVAPSLRRGFGGQAPQTPLQFHQANSVYTSRDLVFKSAFNANHGHLPRPLPLHPNRLQLSVPL